MAAWTRPTRRALVSSAGLAVIWSIPIPGRAEACSKMPMMASRSPDGRRDRKVAIWTCPVPHTCGLNTTCSFRSVDQTRLLIPAARASRSPSAAAWSARPRRKTCCRCCDSVSGAHAAISTLCRKASSASDGWRPCSTR